ncbi:MAG TPA: hypothetical protein VJU82_00225 [Acidobacteriaceae bacterium]|nr:hypothetical protein [Acidobacteriaceae bacterium]
MGTSSSRRSPDMAVWRLLNRQIEQGLPTEALARTLFRAADGEWRELISGPGVLIFAQRAASLWSTLPEALSRHEHASQALAETAREARVDAISAGYVSQAVPLAERALYRTLLGSLREQEQGGEDPPAAEAGHSWEARRPATAEALAQRFLAETLREAAAYIVSRDAPQHLGPSLRDVSASIDLEDRLGGIAAATAYATTLTQVDAADWASCVTAAFEAGAGRTAQGGAS